MTARRGSQPQAGRAEALVAPRVAARCPRVSADAPLLLSSDHPNREFPSHEPAGRVARGGSRPRRALCRAGAAAALGGGPAVGGGAVAALVGGSRRGSVVRGGVPV